MYAAALLVFSLLPITFGSPALDRRSLFVRSQLDVVPSGFIAGSTIPGDTIKLKVALPQGNVAGLHAALLDVSNPSSSNYRQHLSKAEVEQFVAPRKDSATAVSGWLSQNGITTTAATASGDMLEFTIPIEQANSLLNANFTSYVHESTNTTMIRTLSYSLPATLEGHVLYVYPTTHFAPPIRGSAAIPSSVHRRMMNTRSIADVHAGCNETIVPSCLQELYNIPTTPATQANNTLFVAGFGSEFADQGDLQVFLEATRPDVNISIPAFAFVSVDNIEDFNGGTDEASLDMQYAVGLATNVPTTYISAGNPSLQVSEFLDMANFLLAQETVPTVLSLSYAANETPEAVSIEVAESTCNVFAQLGARGTSVLFSSGDAGVAGNSAANPECLANNVFLPTFPSGCPFITSVGATQGIPETAAPYSSGGFSNYFPRPDYQSAAVNAYLQALGSTNQGLFNVTGRAYPDVSMQGSNFDIVVSAQQELVNGTSASTPSFAALVSLLNDQLIAADQPQLGFLNPLIYQAGPAGFNDITTGSNPGCGTNGFPAAEGWDPVTGMGTPDFAKLLALAVGNPARAAPPVSSLPPTSTSAAPPESTTALSSPTMGTGDDSAEEELAKLFEDALALLKTLVGPESE